MGISIYCTLSRIVDLDKENKKKKSFFLQNVTQLDWQLGYLFHTILTKNELKNFQDFLGILQKCEKNI